jgi:hypothetical protein
LTISVIVCAHNEDPRSRSRWRLELQRRLRGMHPADIAHVPVFRALDDVHEAARSFSPACADVFVRVLTLKGAIVG